MFPSQVRELSLNEANMRILNGTIDVSHFKLANIKNP